MENQENHSFPGKGQPVDPSVQMTNMLELSRNIMKIFQQVRVNTPEWKVERNRRYKEESHGHFRTEKHIAWN